MDLKYPELGRPQKKLRYFPNQECGTKSKELQDKMWQLKDIEHLFDDLDSPSEEDVDLPPLSPVLKKCPPAEEDERVEGRASLVPEPAEICLSSQAVTLNMLKREETQTVESPTLDVEIVSPFKDLNPIKTSSPIEWMVKIDGNRDNTVSPLLFICGDDDHVQGPPKSNCIPSPKTQCNGQTAGGGDSVELDSPPTKFALPCKYKTPDGNNKAETPCEENNKNLKDPPQKVPSAAQKSRQKEPLQAKTCPSISAVTQETKPPPQIEPRPTQMTGSKSIVKEKDVFAFLSKLREASQPMSACSKRVPSTVNEPLPLPPVEAFDDDFVILEDDGPRRFSIPKKADPNKSNSRAKQRKVQSSSSNGDVSADVVQPEIATGEQETPGGTENTMKPKTKGRKEKAAHRGSQMPILPTCTGRKDVMKIREKKNLSPRKETSTTSHTDGVISQEDCLVDDFTDQDKPQPKKKTPRKVSSKATAAEDREKDQPNISTEADKTKPNTETEKKAPKSSEVRKSKTIKDGQEKLKRAKGKSAKKNREACQGLESSKAASQPGHVEEREEDEGAVDFKPPSVEPEEREQTTFPKGQRRANKDPAKHKGSETQPSTVSDAVTSTESQVLGRRKRSKPGAWWLGVSDTTQTEADPGPAVKKSKQINRKMTKPTVSLSMEEKEKQEGGKEDSDRRQTALSSKRPAEPRPEKVGSRPRQTKKRKGSREKPEKTPLTEEEVEVITDHQGQGELSPQPSPLRQHTPTPGENVFVKVYSRTPKGKQASKSNPCTPQRPHNHLKTPVNGKRHRRATSHWWNVNGAPGVKSTSSPPRKPKSKNSKPLKVEASQSKTCKSPALGPPQNANTTCSPKSCGQVPDPSLKKKEQSAPKSVKRSLAMFGAIFTSGNTASPVAKVRNPSQRGGRKTLFSSQEQGPTQSSLSRGPSVEDDVPGQDPATSSALCDKSSSIVGPSGTSVGMESSVELGKRLSWPSNSKRLSDNTLQGFKSGPSSMIELEHYEEDEDLCLPSSMAVLPVQTDSELCGPPLRPPVLQKEDMARLKEWLRVLWPTTIQNGGQITPDQFQWFSYRGRAMGLRVDLQVDSFSNGKILLGSFMKKPLWVDHNATSVYNVLTSCVSVTINGKVSQYNPGQTFMIPCGHAYSIHNLAQEPAVLYFNRMLTEGPE